MKLNKISIFIIPIYLLILHPLSAQTATLKFNHIGLEQGLSQSTVNAIVQDYQGFMWFGTQDGLNRFDGYTVTVFKHDANDLNSISDNTIWSLLCDSTGDLWIGTEKGGLNRYVISENKFYHYEYNSDDTTTISDNYIRCLFEDSNGDIWIGTRNRGINRYNRTSGEFSRFLFKDGLTLNQSNTVWKICEDNDRNLWVATLGGLYKLNLDAKHYTTGLAQFALYNRGLFDSINLNNNDFHELYIDHDGVLWIGKWENGLYYLNAKTHTIKHYPNTAKSIRSIYEDPDGNIWIGSLDLGLGVMDRFTNKFIDYSNIFQSLDLQNDRVNEIYEDKSGIVWIGTLVQGVCTYDERKGNFKHYLDDLKNSNIVTSILKDRKGDTWVGTYGNGLYCFNAKNKKFVNFKFDSNKSNSLSSNRIFSLCEASDGSIWIGTQGGGLNLFDKRTRTFKHYKKNTTENPKGLSNDNVITLYEDGRGDLWIGNAVGGVDCLNRKTNTFKHYKVNEKNPGVPSRTFVTAILEDNNGSLWIGTAGAGLQQFIPDFKNDKAEAGSFKQYDLLPKSVKIGMSSEINLSVQSIYIDDLGIIWIGTRGDGLVQFNPDNNSIIYFTEKDGLPNNVVYGILPDKSGNLWLSTNKGISRFSPNNKIFRNYDMKDGLQANEFNQGAYFISQDGEMFFGGINGFNSFYPEEIEDNKYVPPVFLTTFKVFDKPIQIHGSISTTKQIELSYWQDFFSFEFVALNYASPEKNQYAFMLEGFDKDWHYVTSLQRYGSYTNLDPGEYVLHIKGSNDDGLWNEKGTSIAIIVTPPFWMTWWFKSLGLFVFLSIVFFIYRLRVQSLENEKKMQQEVSRLLIKKQEEERKRIAQEMHDSMGQDLLFIKNRAELTILKNSVDQSTSEHLHQISTTAAGILKAVRQISHNLRPPELDRLGLSETLRYFLLTARNSTTINIQGEVDDIDNIIPRELEISIIRIVQEGVGNIIKHSEASECNILIHKHDEKLQIQISDNGKGFEKTDLSIKESGLGLTGINERVRILGGELEINTSIGAGTKLEIEIPLKKI